MEGNTILASREMDSLLAPYVGEKKDLQSIQEAIKALERGYHDRGFVAVQVILPEQELKDGVVRLKVIEPRLGKITVEGNRFFDEANIRRSLPALRPGAPLNVVAVSRSIEDANDSPAKKVNLQFLNGGASGEIDAKIQVQDEKPWAIGLTSNTTGDKQTGYWRLEVQFQEANLFNRDHLVTLQYITSPSNPDQVNIAGLGYRIPIARLRSSIEIIGAYSNVDSGTLSLAGNSTQVSGSGTILGLHYNQNLPGIGRYNQQLTFALDLRAYTNSVVLSGAQLANDVTVHPISLTYAGKRAWTKAAAGFYAGVVHNLPEVAVRDTEAQFEKVRAGAPQDYTILKFGANVSHSLVGDWRVHGTFNGQYTNVPLVPGEQFGIGGATSVRGFHEREAADDKGYAGSFEIHAPNLRLLPEGMAAQWHALLFADVGHISRVNPLPGETPKTTIASFGPGIRVNGGKRFFVAFDYGVILDPLTGGKNKWGGLCDMTVSFMY